MENLNENVNELVPVMQDNSNDENVNELVPVTLDNSTNVDVPCIHVKAYEDDHFGLIGISGNKTLFMRFGEFLAMMCNQDHYVFNIVKENESGDLSSSPVQVELLPIEDENEVEPA